MREAIQTAIDNCVETKVLNLQNMQITDDEVADIIEAAKQRQPELTVINLKNNQLEDTGAVALSESIQDCHKLAQVNVEYNQLSHDGITAIARLKLVHRDLQLFFHGNQVIDVGQMDEIYSKLHNGPR
ncbi:MAG: hypothetical protein P1U32_07425 [Legionellaceae bacterium]|nr:hypothetical protein [Legionellaceae bacterium]